MPTRLSAVDEAASMDVLCSDKTGKLTRNELKVTAVREMPGFDEAHVLKLAALASSDGGDDPVDGAIRAAAAEKNVGNMPALVHFVPFDSATKMSTAMVTSGPEKLEHRIVKGAFATVSSLAGAQPGAAGFASDLQANGYRALAVAFGAPKSMQLAGLIS